MHEAALDILYFLDGVAENRRRQDMVLSAAVSSGMVTPMQAWPDFFPDDEGDPGAFPSTGADMAGFELEEATPASFERDMEMIVAANQRITLREEEPPPFPRLPLPDTEWTL